MDIRHLHHEMHELADWLADEIMGDAETVRRTIEALALTSENDIDGAGVLRLPESVLRSAAFRTATTADIERLIWLRGLDAALIQATGYGLNGGDMIGPALIEEEEFEDWARGYADETGAIRPAWPANHIDWSAAAAELRSDFCEFEYDGETYLIR